MRSPELGIDIPESTTDVARTIPATDPASTSLVLVRGVGGRTAEGARVGDDRARILQLYGTPRRQYADADRWHFGDVGFWFDGRGKVGRMYVRNLR